MTTTSVASEEPSEPSPAPRRPIVLRGCDVPTSYNHMAQLAVQLGRATLLIPGDLQGKPDDIMAIMWQAKALDLPLMVCIQHMYVQDGTIGALAELQLALMRRAGHDLKPVLDQWNENEVVAELVMADGFHARLSFTIAEAATAQLLHKRNWERYPKRMLWARMVTQTCTTYCPEVLMGLATDRAETFEARFEAGAAGQVAEPVVGPELRKLMTSVGKAAALDDPRLARDRLQSLWVRNKVLLDCVALDDGTTLREVLSKHADTVVSRMEEQHKKATDSGSPAGPEPEQGEQEPSTAAKVIGGQEIPDGEDSPKGAEDRMSCGCSFSEVIDTGAHARDCLTGGLG